MGTIKWLTNCFTDVFTCHQESYARNQRCVQHHELRATDCYFLGGFVQSNLSKPCAIPKLPLRGSYCFCFAGAKSAPIMSTQPSIKAALCGTGPKFKGGQ